jgi:hypothetical protein
MVLKLMERIDAKVFTLEEVRPRIEAALREIQNDDRLAELLAKWKEEYGVTIYEKNLQKTQITERSAAEATATSQHTHG